jgi:hypothetical protein
MGKFVSEGRSRSAKIDILFELSKRAHRQDSRRNKRAFDRLKTKILNAASKLFAIAFLHATIGMESTVVLVTIRRRFCG